jgi:hypothetical protein
MKIPVTLTVMSLALGACHESPRTSDAGTIEPADGAVLADAPQPPPPDGNQASPIETMPGHENLAQDTTPKRGPRLMPVESYIRSYLQLFGGLSPLATATAIRARDATLFDTWNDYVASLGLPDHRVDINRGTQTSPLWLATLERAGIALCDVAVLRELDPATPPPVASRAVFAFDLPPGTLDRAGFTSRFDALHRTFLGYPASLAPEDRAGRYWDLYARTVARFTAASGAPASAFRVKSNAGWAAVCYALIRHPEFQMY